MENGNETEIKRTRKKRFFLSGTNYLREISVVVLGVAITLLAGAWINNHQAKKQLRGYLSAVKMEMQYNLALLEDHQPFYDRMESFVTYLVSHPREDLEADSMEHHSLYRPYNSVINDFFTLAVETSAYDMLKSSGAMNNIKDLDFLQSIMKCYNDLAVQKKNSDEYMDRKLDLLYRCVVENQLLFTEFDLLDSRMSELFYFMATSHFLHKTNQNCILNLENTLEIFRRKKIN